MIRLLLWFGFWIVVVIGILVGRARDLREPRV